MAEPPGDPPLAPGEDPHSNPHGYPPLAPGEDLTHTNADLSAALLNSLPTVKLNVPPLKVPIVKVERAFTASMDPDPVDGLVRLQVLTCDVRGLSMRELRARPHTAPPLQHQLQLAVLSLSLKPKCP
jgi:hypothetical protein